MPSLAPFRLHLALFLSICTPLFSDDIVAANELLSIPNSTASEYLLPLNNSTNRWLSVGQRSGIRLLDQQYQTLDIWQRNAEFLDSRTVTREGFEHRLFTSFDSSSNQVLMYSYDPRNTRIKREFVSPPVSYPVEGLCLYKDENNLLHLFLLSERFQAHQYLLQFDSPEHWRMLAVRSLPIGPETEFCAVEDVSGTLFVSEAEQTLWAYSANPEAEVRRRLVELATPYGGLGSGPLGLSATEGALHVLASEGPILYRFDVNNDSIVLNPEHTLNLDTQDLSSPESLSTITHQDVAYHNLFDEEEDRFTIIQQTLTTSVAKQATLPVVKPLHETDPMPQSGDAADDPALWIHPDDTSRSLIVATNKRQGLFIYNLAGETVQQLDIGRLNNVDVRYGMALGEETIDIAVASNRDLNALSVFGISRQTGSFELLATIDTPLQDIYGLCMYQDRSGKIYTFANDSDGNFLQYALFAEEKTITAELVRQFQVSSQPEACVADDATGQLFIGEEDVGIWTLGAGSQDSITLVAVAKIGEDLHDDVEGLALIKTNDRSILIASSQGNDSYVLFAATPPYQTIGAFRIGMNLELEIDGASETDGLELSNINLGGHYSEGLLIVQDGRNVLPEQAQNFKLVPWRDIKNLFPNL